MLLQAILLGLVAMLGNAEYLFGTSLLSRPLVMGTLTGIVLGDVQTGVTLGATLELAFMGAFSIGASIPPEMISGTVLGTAFTITTGAGPETALTVGLPVASLVLIAKNIGMVFILPPFVHKADTDEDIRNLKYMSSNLYDEDLDMRLFIDKRVYDRYDLSNICMKTWDVVRKLEWKEKCDPAENEELFLWNLY